MNNEELSYAVKRVLMSHGMFFILNYSFFI